MSVNRCRDVMNYILERGVKCIGTDGPSMGSVNPEEATEVLQHLLDLIQVLAAMLGAQQHDRATGRRILREQFVR